MPEIEVPKEVLISADQIRMYEPLEKSLIVRQALIYGFRELKQELAIKLFSEGKVTISEASRLAGLPVGEMMSLLARRGIKSKVTVEDFERGLRTALEIV